MHFDLADIIKQAGPVLGLLSIWIIVFIESGLLIGFFLPGDSLLFTAGFLASQGYLSIFALTVGSFIAAVAGDSAGYLIGHKFGRRLFKKEDSIFFHKDHLRKAQNFYEKHGGKTIILARFMPVIRTFAPIVAGIGEMKYSTFLFYNIFGGLLWAVGITLSGFYLGKLIPDVDKFLLPIIGFIIIVSVAPGIYHIFKDARNMTKLIQLVRVQLSKVIGK